MEMPFARLLSAWFIAFVAVSAVLTMFPLSVIQTFGVSPRLPATTYAFAAALSLMLRCRHPQPKSTVRGQSCARALPHASSL